MPFGTMQKSVKEKKSQSPYKADEDCENGIKEIDQYLPTNK